MINKIEIDFATPVVLSDDDQRKLYTFVDRLARANCPVGSVHWASGCGSKLNWSQKDAAFLGVNADSNVPVDGEPTWDDTVFHISTSIKEKIK